MPTDKTLRSFLRVEQKLSDSERRIKNPFIFCVPVKAAGDKSAKSSAVTLLESLPATIAASAFTATFVSEQKDSTQRQVLLETAVVGAAGGNGTANTGGGGGGGGTVQNGSIRGHGGDGGSGIVIVRYAR